LTVGDRAPGGKRPEAISSEGERGRNFEGKKGDNAQCTERGNGWVPNHAEQSDEASIWGIEESRRANSSAARRLRAMRQKELSEIRSHHSEKGGGLEGPRTAQRMNQVSTSRRENRSMGGGGQQIIMQKKAGALDENFLTQI